MAGTKMERSFRRLVLYMKITKGLFWLYCRAKVFIQYCNLGKMWIEKHGRGNVVKPYSTGTGTGSFFFCQCLQLVQLGLGIFFTGSRHQGHH